MPASVVVRRPRSFQLVAGTIAIAAASVHCGTTIECTLADCRSGATIELHVPRTIEALAEASIRLCHGDTCVEKPSSMSPGHITKTGWGLWITQPMPTELSVERRSGGWSTVRLEPFLSGRDYLPDGDRYTAEIRDRDGALVLAFDRGVVYEHSAPNGESCGPRCSTGMLEGYPESGPQAACTGKACVSGARFEFVAPVSFSNLMDGRKLGRFQVCRNAMCALSVRDEVSEWRRTFEGDLAGVTLEAKFVNDETSRIVLTFVDLPVLLAPGDHYSFAMVNDTLDSREVLFEKTVEAYEERWPNGESCDLYPCRMAGSMVEGGL
jgi:hypothetical protein